MRASTAAAAAGPLLLLLLPFLVEAFVLPPLSSSSCPRSSSATRKNKNVQQRQALLPQQHTRLYSSFWLDPTNDTPLQTWSITETQPGTPFGKKAGATQRNENGEEEEDEVLQEKDEENQAKTAASAAGASMRGSGASCCEEGNCEEGAQMQKKKEKRRGITLNLFKAISGGGSQGQRTTTTTALSSSSRARALTRTAAATASSSSSPSNPSSSASGSTSFLTALRSAADGSTTETGTPQNNIQVLAELMNSDPFKRLLVWLSFLGLGWKLRSFYGIMLGTFVLSYIGSSAVRFSEKKGNQLLHRLKLPALHRRIWALGYICIVLTGFLSLTVVTVPRVVGETNYLSLLVESENPYVFVADGIRNFLGPDVSSKFEAFLLTVTGEEGRAFANGVLVSTGASAAGSGGGGSAQQHAAAVAKALGSTDPSNGIWTAARKSRFSKLMEYSLKGYIKQAYYLVQKLISSSTKLVYKGLLSLLFSFMIIWDLPRLAKGTKKLAHSRLGYAYSVLAPQVTAFGKLVGQSFEVQSVIALVNTLLTTMGLLVLKIPGYGFMSLVVLITSFIPVFGVFLSTFPMALVALSEYGVGKMIDVILMVIGIHVVEAYCLSPLIYSATVKLHPVLIIASLYMMEHLAGLQGVFLAVPVTMFVIRQVIGIQGSIGGGHGHGGGGGGEEEEEEEGVVLVQQGA